jgi:dTDP-4-amino-4,6-dideoxygalactose transaminase
MINYIQKKRVNYGAVQEYLKFSKDQNHYTNNGPVKRLLEDKISDLISLPSGKRVLCASNGTTALHAIMCYYDAINSGFKQSWISPAFTFPSCSVNASNTTIYDIDKESYTLREEDGKYSNVIITNLFGTVIPFKGLSTVTIYDNASSFLSKDNDGNNISLMGDMSFSSLHHTKTLGFGEGGFLVLPSELYDEIQRILGFGFNDARDYKELSSNFKMSDTAAAFILQHIDSYNVDRHLEIQNEFVSRLSGKENYELFNYSTGVFYGNLPILFNKNAEVKYFRDRCIEANKYYKPLKPLHNSIDLYNRIINFPLHEDITEEEINIICTTLDSYDSGN